MIPEALQRAMHQLLVLPGEAAEKQSRPPALVFGEGTLNGALELVQLALDQAGFALQTRALFGHAFLDDVFDAGVDLYQTGRYGLRFKRLSAHSAPLSSGVSGYTTPDGRIFAR